MSPQRGVHQPCFQLAFGFPYISPVLVFHLPLHSLLSSLNDASANSWMILANSAPVVVHHLKVAGFFVSSTALHGSALTRSSFVSLLIILILWPSFILLFCPSFLLILCTSFVLILCPSFVLILCPSFSWFFVLPLSWFFVLPFSWFFVLPLSWFFVLPLSWFFALPTLGSSEGDIDFYLLSNSNVTLTTATC